MKKIWSFSVLTLVLQASLVYGQVVCPPALHVRKDTVNPCMSSILSEAGWLLVRAQNGCDLAKWNKAAFPLASVKRQIAMNGDKTAPMEHLNCIYSTPGPAMPPVLTRTVPPGQTCKVSGPNSFFCSPMLSLPPCPAVLPIITRGGTEYSIQYPAGWSVSGSTTKVPLNTPMNAGRMIMLQLKETSVFTPWLSVLCQYTGPDVKFAYISKPFPANMYCGLYNGMSISCNYK